MKMVLLGVIALLLILGGVYGAATFGFLDIPGVSPYKYGKPLVASTNPTPGFLSTFALPMQKLKAQVQAIEAVKPKAPKANSDSKVAKPDPQLGDEKLASLWNDLESKTLVEITQKWPPNNLASILTKMDPDQVTAYIQALPTDRATQVSKAIKEFASLPAKPEEAND